MGYHRDQNWLMFFIYINNMVEGVDSYNSLFAGDAKVMRRIEKEDCQRLQEDTDKVVAGVRNGK